MKYFSLILMLMVVVGFTAVQAQQQEDVRIANAVELLRKAMIDADAAMLNTLTHESLSYGHSSGVVEDKKAFIENVVKGKPAFLNIKLENQTITCSQDVAIVRHRFLAETKSNDVVGSISIGVLLIWKKENNDWKLIARQAFR
jgi:hypothetical protein